MTVKKHEKTFFVVKETPTTYCVMLTQNQLLTLLEFYIVKCRIRYFQQLRNVVFRVSVRIVGILSHLQQSRKS